MLQRLMLRRLAAAIFACAVLGAVRPAAAQLTTADIVGSVTDTSGGVVPGVTVTIINTGTQVPQVVVSDRAGNYVVNLLPPGRYSVRAAELTALRTTAVTPADIVASPAGGVGVITSTQPGSAPRQLQFGFKLMV